MDEKKDTIPLLLTAAAVTQGDAIAHLTSAGEELTYAQWHQRSDLLAKGLIKRGVRPGDRIGILFRSNEWVDLAVSYVGVHKAGASCVLLSYQWFPAELESVLLRARCVGAVVGGLIDLTTDSCWVANPRELIDLTLGGEPPTDLSRADEVADVIFTSGTTGTPKGIAYTHANATFEARFNGGAVPWQVFGGMCIHAHPPFGAGGQARIVLPLLARMPVMALESFDPRQFCDAVEAFSIPHLSLVPAMAVELATWSGLHRYDLSSVRTVSFGSAPIAAATLRALAEAIPKATLYNQYSSTEALPSRLRGPYDPSSPDQVGFPDHLTEVSIRDPGTGSELANGQTGEVWLRMPGVQSREYFEDPEATRQTFVDGWTRMGDLGRRDSVGRLVLVDRIKDVINRGGIKVSPRQVELVLESHPQVVEAAVFPAPHPVLGEDVAAIVVGRSELSIDDLRGFLRERLPVHQMPKQIGIADSLPRTDVGKVAKASLFSLLGESPTSNIPAGGTIYSPTEAAVSAVWKSVLVVAEVGLDDNLFDLGGDSLRAVRIVAEACEVGIQLEPVDIFDHPTVRELAQLADRRRMQRPGGI